MTTHRMIRKLVVLAALLPMGCGGGGKPVEVEGFLTLEGKPFPGAMIQFIPEVESGRAANGFSGTGGEFRLTTFNTGDGAIAGSYKVVVTVPETADASSAPASGGGGEGKELIMKMKAHFEKTKGKPRVDSKKGVVPKSYTSSSTTPLKATIPTDGPVKLDMRSSGS